MKKSMKQISRKTIMAIAVLMCFSVGVALAASNQVISIVTGGTGGTYFIIGSGMAKIIEKYVPNTKVSVESTAATTENIRILGTKQAQFGIVMPDGAYYGYIGGREYKTKYPDLRAVMGGHSSPMHFVVRSNSGIKSLADAKGKKVSLCAPGSTGVFMSESALKGYGLVKNKDYKNILLSYSEQATALRDGAIDMACIFAGAPTAAVVDLCMTHDVTLLDVGPKGLKQVLKDHPYCKEYVIKAGTYKGQNKGVKTFATSSMLATQASVPADLVYSVIKTICEHNDELKAVHPQGAEYDLADATVGVAIPFHPGASKYLKEKGIIK